MPLRLCDPRIAKRKRLPYFPAWTVQLIASVVVRSSLRRTPCRNLIR